MKNRRTAPHHSSDWTIAEAVAGVGALAVEAVRVQRAVTLCEHRAHNAGVVGSSPTPAIAIASTRALRLKCFLVRAPPESLAHIWHTQRGVIELSPLTVTQRLTNPLRIARSAGLSCVRTVLRLGPKMGEGRHQATMLTAGLVV